MNAVDDLERRMGITKHWTPEQEEYKRALDLLMNCHFIRIIEQLEGLVVKRLFKLAKANLAGTGTFFQHAEQVLIQASTTGYKLRQYISNAIARCSVAICAALDKYNNLAPLQNLPRPTLEYHEVASYAWLGEFDLLKHSRQDLLSMPWASKTNHEVATKYFKVLYAHEEITWLNVEVAWLHRWVDDKDAHLSSVARSLSESNPALAYEIQHQFKDRCWVNCIHCTRLEAVYNLPGYSSLIQVAEERRDGDDGIELVLSNLGGSCTILVDEDDTLCDEASHLDACMSE